MRAGRFLDPAGRVVTPTVWRARPGWETLRGLLGRPDWPPDAVLLLPTHGIHTVGLRHPLTVVSLRRTAGFPHQMVVVARALMPPGRFGPWRWDTAWVAETDGPALDPLRVGSMVRWMSVPLPRS